MKINISYSEEDQMQACRLVAMIQSMFPGMRQKVSGSHEKYVHIYFVDKQRSNGQGRKKDV